MLRLHSVLVVDDDPLQLEVMRDYLTRQKVAKITCVSDGQIAINLLSAPQPHSPELLITDIHMPGLDGIEILAFLTASAQPPPVLLVSGSGARQLQSAAILAKGSGLTVLGALSKPVVTTELDAALARFAGPS